MGSMPVINFLDTGDVRLRVVDFGGSGIPVLLLHGLCGTANEWFETASWLQNHARVVAYDQRGHGESTRSPHDLGRNALVRDAVAVMNALQMQNTIVIGQSIGGRIALLLASTMPDRIRASVLVEAGAKENPHAKEQVERWLSSWPDSFASVAEAGAFFEAWGLPPATWITNLEYRSHRLYPAFSSEVMLAIVEDAANVSLWESWLAIRSEILLVAGEHGFVRRNEFETMLAVNERACLEEIPQAGHDVHLSGSPDWKRVIIDFIERVAVRE